MRLTSLRSPFSRRLSAGVAAKRRRRWTSRSLKRLRLANQVCPPKLEERRQESPRSRALTVVGRDYGWRLADCRYLFREAPAAEPSNPRVRIQRVGSYFLPYELGPAQRATNHLPVLRQARKQQGRCAAGPEGGDVRRGRTPAKDLRRGHREDSPDDGFVHRRDALRPRGARGAGDLAQRFRAPRSRGHVHESARQQQIIRTCGKVRRCAAGTREHVRPEIRRESVQAAPGRADIVVVEAVEEGFAGQGTINSLRSAWRPRWSRVLTVPSGTCRAG